MSFETLGLSAELLRAVGAQGYSTATPIQAQAIPAVLAGRDLLAGAQTGTGKTAAFTLPLLQLLSKDNERSRRPRALVLTPTRELAAQVGESVKSYGRHLPLQAIQIFGGVGMAPQVAQLRRGVDIVVATPGRLLDLAGQGHVDLSGIRILILDEADRMLDMGFIRDIRRIISMLPGQRQNLMFSATYSKEIEQLARGLLNDPERIEVAGRNTAAETVDQRVHPVAHSHKRALLSHLIQGGSWSQVLVFTRTKHGANRLTKQLQQDGITAAAIHGNKSQSARTRALAGFKQGEVRALVATDIAARGLDIGGLPHVVNFEMPNVPEDYVHRIGRTGRAGAEGTAISLVSPEERGLLAGIERMLRRHIPSETIPGFHATDPVHSASDHTGYGAGHGQRQGQDQGQRRHHARPRADGRDGGDGAGHHRGQGRGQGGNDNRRRGTQSRDSR